MRKIKYFERELTVEEYVKIQICKNDGTQSLAFKYNLEKECHKLGLKLQKKVTKEDLFNLLIENGMSHEDLAGKYGVGVSSQDYQKTFNITHQDVKRLEKHGVIKVAGEYRFRAYGHYKYASLYDVYQFASMTDEDMQKLLLEYPKGKRVKRSNANP